MGKYIFSDEWADRLYVELEQKNKEIERLKKVENDLRADRTTLTKHNDAIINNLKEERNIKTRVKKENKWLLEYAVTSKYIIYCVKDKTYRWAGKPAEKAILKTEMQQALKGSGD